MRNAGDDELLLDGAGRPGHVRSQRDHSQDRLGGPPPSFDPSVSPRRHHLVELEFQGVHCPSQYRAKRIRALLHEQVARVKSFRQRGDGQVHILADEYLEGAVHARLAAGVCIKHQHHARHADPPDALHVPLVQGRSHGGDHLVHACLVGCQHVHVAFHHGQKTGLGGSLPRQVQSIEMFALGKNGRVRGIVILRRIACISRTGQNPPTERHGLPASVPDGKHDPVPEAIVMAGAFLSFSDQADFLQ